MNIPHEVLSVVGTLVGQVLHVVKKKTEEEPLNAYVLGEANIFIRYIWRRPFNTLAAALVGASASVGLTAGEVAEAMSGVQVFLSAVVAGIAANSVVNRPGT